jgi:hypothetical protein
LLQFGETELDLAAGAIAADGKPPGIGIHLRNIRQMVANEEDVVGCDRAAQMLDRRLVVRRQVGELDERLLTWQSVECGLGSGALGQLHRQIQRAGFSSGRPKRPRDCVACTGQ